MRRADIREALAHVANLLNAYFEEKEHLENQAKKDNQEGCMMV
jgi:hypothetical protein